MGFRDKVGQSKKYFNDIAESYDSLNSLQHTKDTYDPFISSIKEKGAKSILDVGCGTGELLSMLSTIVPDARLYGMDISANMLAIAEEKLEGRAEFILGDSSHIPLETGSCDVVCCNHSFHHYPHPFNVAKEFQRVLKADGILLIGENYWPAVRRLIYNMINILIGQNGDVWFYSEREFHFLLSRYFGTVHYKRIDERSCFISAHK